MNKMKESKAITLITLIITIIVLLILAGVVINMTLGNDGIISKAQGAVDMYKNAQEKEEFELAKMVNEIDNVYGNRNSDLASQTQGTATADDIVEGKIAWVNGEKIIGRSNKKYSQEELDNCKVSDSDLIFIGQNLGTSISIEPGYKLIIVSNGYYTGGSTNLETSTQVQSYTNCNLIHNHFEQRNVGGSSSYRTSNRVMTFGVTDTTKTTTITLAGSDFNFVYAVQE